MKTSDIFEGDNSSLKKTFEEAVRHEENYSKCPYRIPDCPKDYHTKNEEDNCKDHFQKGHDEGINLEGCKLNFCPAQKEDPFSDFMKSQGIDPKHPKGPIWHDYDDYLLCIDFIASQISLAEARGREEANKCDECGGTDVVCAKGVMDSIRLARTETITAFEEWAGKYMTETTKYYGTDKHGIDPDDLLSFASFLKSNAPKV